MDAADQPPFDDPPQRPRRWQFSLRFLFALMTLAAVGTALGTVAIRTVGVNLAITFVGIVAVIAVTAESAGLLDRWHWGRKHRSLGLTLLGLLLLMETVLGILLLIHVFLSTFFAW